MTVLAMCPNGHVFDSVVNRLMALGATVQFVGNMETCPQCGALTASPDGTFRLGDEVLKAVRQPGVTRESVEAFRNIAEAVRTGDTSADEAAEQLRQISAAFATILRWANENGGALAALIGLLALILTAYGIVCSDRGSAQARADSQAQLHATERQTQAIQSSEESRKSELHVQQKINEEIARANALSEPADGPRNRHKRRKAAKLAKGAPAK